MLICVRTRQLQLIGSPESATAPQFRHKTETLNILNYAIKVRNLQNYYTCMRIVDGSEEIWERNKIRVILFNPRRTQNFIFSWEPAL